MFLHTLQAGLPWCQRFNHLHFLFDFGIRNKGRAADSQNVNCVRRILNLLVDHNAISEISILYFLLSSVLARDKQI